MRSTGKWSHWQHSSCATMKHHETCNKKTKKNLPHRLFVSVPQRTTTRGDAKTADVIPFFSTKDDSNKLPLKTTASQRALHTAIIEGNIVSGSFWHLSSGVERDACVVTRVVQCVGSGNVGTPNVSSTTETTKNIDHLVPWTKMRADSTWMTFLRPAELRKLTLSNHLWTEMTEHPVQPAHAPRGAEVSRSPPRWRQKNETAQAWLGIVLIYFCELFCGIVECPLHHATVLVVHSEVPFKNWQHLN